MFRVLTLVLFLVLSSSFCLAAPVIREEEGRIVVEYEGEGAEPAPAQATVPMPECKEILLSALDRIAKLLVFEPTDPKNLLMEKLLQIEALLPERKRGLECLDTLCNEGNCDKGLLTSSTTRIAKQDQAIKSLRTFAENAASISIEDVNIQVVEQDAYGTTFSYAFKATNVGSPARIGFRLVGVDDNASVLVDHQTGRVTVAQDESKVVSGKSFERTPVVNRVTQWRVEVDGVHRVKE